MHTNLYAYTVPAGSCPAYVSLNVADNGAVSLSVRTQGANSPGEILMSDDQLGMLAQSITQHLDSKAKQ